MATPGEPLVGRCHFTRGQTAFEIRSSESSHKGRCRSVRTETRNCRPGTLTIAFQCVCYSDGVAFPLNGIRRTLSFSQPTPDAVAVAFLKVIKGTSSGQLLTLSGDRTILGRHPSCQIVLDNGSVSRQHAQIIESEGAFFIEDLHSRNGTQVNGSSIRGRTELGDGDEVQVCDYAFHFKRRADRATAVPDSGHAPVVRSVVPLVSGLRETVDDDDDDEPMATGPQSIEPRVSDNSSVITALEAGSSARGLRLNVRPEIKLRAVLEISAALGRLLKLEDVLPVILKSLFKIFPQADWGFVLLKEGDGDQLRVRASWSRRPDDEDEVPISMTVVRQAMADAQAILSADVMGDRRFRASESLTELQLRSLMCVPLTDTAGTALGVIQLSTLDVSQPFNADDLDLLVSVSAQASLAVENATLHDTVLRQRDYERDMEFAAQVQHGFLPSHPPKLEGYEFADYYEAAFSVGGDYFDYVWLPDGRVAVAIGDVAGKGVSAALLMARLHASARYHLLSACSPSKAMNSLNVEVANSGLGFRFITLAFAVIDPKTNEICISNAGHLPPVLRCADGRVELLGMNESGMPLGISPDQQFEELVVRLQPGESLLFYTDGITEAMNAKNELYGKHRLMQAVSSCGAPARDLVKALVTSVELFGNSSPQRDDICITAVRRVH